MTQTGEEQFRTNITKDPDKDKEFHERKDPLEGTIEHTFATTSITEGRSE